MPANQTASLHSIHQKALLSKKSPFCASVMAQMSCEGRRLSDAVLELRVKAALTSNRLTRLHSPALRRMVAALKELAAKVRRF